MHHYLSKVDWLAELNDHLGKLGCRLQMMFDRDMVLVEEDWANGRNPEDVAEAIANGTHARIEIKPTHAETEQP